MPRHRVVLIGVDHLCEYYRANEGPRKRHRKLRGYLDTLISPDERIGCVVEEAGPGMVKEEQLQSGQEGTVPKDFASARGARFRFADMGMEECRRILAGRDPRNVGDGER